MMTSSACRPEPSPAHRRLKCIDALRGLVVLIMLVDHVRETFFLHHQVPDPMVVAETEPALFFSRLLAHLCAPVFVFLTGLSAWLHAAPRGGDARTTAASFLWRRGLFLVLLEITVINFAWTAELPPTRLYLQVIWALGLSMLALAALLWLPRRVLVATGLILVAGHNLLDGLHFAPDHPLHEIWAVLHDRGWIDVSETLRVRTSYPLLPWAGVIALGYAAGPWFGPGADAAGRGRRLLAWGLALLAGFALLRTLDVYGDRPWSGGDTLLATAMAALNVTKYPPSLLFCALTLGIGLLLLRAFDQRGEAGWLRVLAVFGAAPMFAYILHVGMLKVLYLAALAACGPNHGTLFGVESMLEVWVGAALLAGLLYPPVRAFGRMKARRRDIAWLKYL